MKRVQSFASLPICCLLLWICCFAGRTTASGSGSSDPPADCAAATPTPPTNGKFDSCAAGADGSTCNGYCNPGFTGNVFATCQKPDWVVSGSCTSVNETTTPEPPASKRHLLNTVEVSSTDGSTASSAGRSLLTNAASTQRVHIPPALKVDGKPANVAPFAVTGTNWQGHDPTDVAVCLSGALVTLSNITAIMSPEAPQEVAQLHTEFYSEAKGIVHDVLPLSDKGITMYTSSMYTGGSKLTAKQLKAELTKHYGGLVQAPGCVELPTYMVNTVYYTLQSFMNAAGGTAGLLAGPKGISGAEALLEVTAVVQDVVQSRRPELCEGIQGTDIRVRFISSLTSAARMPESLWVYTASDGVHCDVSTT